MGLRTFLAIDLPSSLHSAIGQKQQQIKRELSGLAWVKPENLHITLKFLGDTPESQIEKVRHAVEKTIKGVARFVIELRGFGVFPDQRAPRILWTGIEGAPDELVDLARRVEESVVPVGFPKEGKSFQPHLTIARIKKDHRQIGQTLGQTGILADPFIFGRLLVEQVCLFKSDLRSTGSVYTKLWEIPLGS